MHDCMTILDLCGCGRPDAMWLVSSDTFKDDSLTLDPAHHRICCASSRDSWNNLNAQENRTLAKNHHCRRHREESLGSEKVY